MIIVRTCNTSFSCYFDVSRVETTSLLHSWQKHLKRRFFYELRWNEEHVLWNLFSIGLQSWSVLIKKTLPRIKLRLVCCVTFMFLNLFSLLNIFLANFCVFLKDIFKNQGESSFWCCVLCFNVYRYL